MLTMTPLQTAIRIHNGPTKLAQALGVSVQCVVNWVSRGVPAERCPDIERATAGAVRCEDLRPDVAWHVLRNQYPAAADTRKAA
jgi:DNA-binding transcriptional regulator YdaS (Cro superfamily)